MPVLDVFISSQSWGSRRSRAFGPLTNSPEDDPSWAVVFANMFTKDQAGEAKKYGHHGLIAVFISGCVQGVLSHALDSLLRLSRN